MGFVEILVIVTMLNNGRIEFFEKETTSSNKCFTFLKESSCRTQFFP